MACFLGISRRTLSDWKRGKFLLPLRVARKLCKQSGHPFPKHAIIEPQFWYTKKAAKIGGTAVLKKYGVVGGNSDERRKQWQRWWDTKGKYQRHSILERQSFRKPRITGHLAEFFGIMLGDGGMSKFQFRITLHHKDDLEFSKYVVRLIQSLFGIRPSIYHRVKMSVNDIAVSRIGLVEYLSSLGLPIGNKTKQLFNIPTWIMERDSLSRACVRGLVDTDGCVVIHKYRVNGKCYVYKKLEFTSASCPLVVSVKRIMEKNIPGVLVVSKATAKSDSYEKTLVLDITGKMSRQAAEVALLVGGQVATQSAEAFPKADLMIIVGADFK